MPLMHNLFQTLKSENLSSSLNVFNFGLLRAKRKKTLMCF
jgi:hypothetical protein